MMKKMLEFCIFNEASDI